MLRIERGITIYFKVTFIKVFYVFVFIKNNILAIILFVLGQI